MVSCLPFHSQKKTNTQFVCVFYHLTTLEISKTKQGLQHISWEIFFLRDKVLPFEILQVEARVWEIFWKDCHVSTWLNKRKDRKHCRRICCCRKKRRWFGVKKYEQKNCPFKFKVLCISFLTRKVLIMFECVGSGWKCHISNLWDKEQYQTRLRE